MRAAAGCTLCCAPPAAKLAAHVSCFHWVLLFRIDGDEIDCSRSELHAVCSTCRKTRLCVLAACNTLAQRGPQ